jgi:hypothetical protein
MDTKLKNVHNKAAYDYQNMVYKKVLHRAMQDIHGNIVFAFVGGWGNDYTHLMHVDIHFL